MRTFEDKPAVRAEVPLLLGIMGPSGGGKTYSALRLATGIQQVCGGGIFVVDTESRRALMYAEKFRFRHVEFKSPFGPLDYLAAIEHCVGKGAKIIIVDSMSYEHDGPGGVLEMHDALMGGDFKKSFQAWMKPKSERRRFINTILQMPVHFIFCFRAKEKMKPVKGEQPREMGFMPIAGEEFVFEMTANCLLLPGAGGVPTWVTDFAGEKMMTKLPEQFRKILDGNRALDETMGQQMAEWAMGRPGASPLTDLPDGWAGWTNEERGENRASKGTDALRVWFESLPVADKAVLKGKLPTWKETAANVKTP